MTGDAHSQVAVAPARDAEPGDIRLRELAIEAGKALAAARKRILAFEGRQSEIPTDREVAIETADSLGGSPVVLALSRFREASSRHRDLLAARERVGNRFSWIPGAAAVAGFSLDRAIEEAKALVDGSAGKVGEARKAALMSPDCAARYRQRQLEVRGDRARIDQALEANRQLEAGLLAIRDLAATAIGHGIEAVRFTRLDFRIENEVESLVDLLTFAIDRRLADMRPGGPAKDPSIHAPRQVALASRPEHLRDDMFDPREIEEVPALDGNYSVPAGKVYLPVSASREIEVMAAGARKGPRGGYYVLLEETGCPEIQPFLPFIARKTIEPIRMDMIPQTSFGASLANMLAKSDWERIRRPAIDEAGGLCKVCGEKGRRQSQSVDCHEIWTYSASSEPDHWGVQRLEGLIAVCEPCHLMFHLGLANVQGRYEIALERIRQVNRWSQPEADRYGAMLGQAWKERSERLWTLDLSLLANAGPLRVTSGWSPADGGVLARETPYGPAHTILLGVDWCFASGDTSVRPARDPDPYY